MTWVFLAHPKAHELKYPMTYGQFRATGTENLEVEVDAEGYKRVRLRFAPYQSLLMRLEGSRVSFEDLGYTPPAAKTTLRKP